MRHYNILPVNTIRSASLSKDALKRLWWMDWYQSHGTNAESTCRHFGISKSVFYRWKNRYNPANLKSLEFDTKTRKPKNVIDGSTNVNYLEQTQILADFLTQKVFNGQTLPKGYRDAIAHFKNRKEELEKLLKLDWRKAAAELQKLGINQLARRILPEAVYDSVAYLQSTDTRLLPDRWDWLNSRTADGYLVYFGGSGADGASVYSWRLDDSRSNVGVCAS